jgi:hypothetical protein
MTVRLAIDADLAEMRAALKLRPMAEFDPGEPARIYDSLKNTVD